VSSLWLPDAAGQCRGGGIELDVRDTGKDFANLLHKVGQIFGQLTNVICVGFEGCMVSSINFCKRFHLAHVAFQFLFDLVELLCKLCIKLSDSSFEFGFHRHLKFFCDSIKFGLVVICQCGCIGRCRRWDRLLGYLGLCGLHLLQCWK